MSVLGGVSSSGLNFTGLGTGIDTSKLVDGLLAPDKAAVQILQQRQSNVTLMQQSFKVLQGNLLDLQSQAARLARAVGGVFDGRNAASSDETAVKAAASSSAAAGAYSLT